MSNAISVKHLAGRCVVMFTNPAERNPLSAAVLDELDRIIDECKAPLVFTGSEDTFASGANLREIAGLDAASAPEFARRGQTMMNRIADLPQMTTAAVNGYCFGGALDLALACKRRIASPKARFAHPGAGLGIITGWGGTQRLPRLVGRSRAMEIFFTAEPITAAEAFRIGLVDLVADDIFNNELLDLTRIL